MPAKYLAEYLNQLASKLIDDPGVKRKIIGLINGYGQKRGVYITSGNGTLTSFSFPHGLGSTPINYSVTAGSADAGGISWITADATNLTVHYTSAPASGTNNLTYNWFAK